MNNVVHILSGGAAEGLVGRLAGGLTVQGTFGAVGAMRDKLLAGEPCDLLILTQALVDDLQAQGQVRPGSAVPLGRVRTGVAVKAGAAVPPVADAQALKALLGSATAIYCPDTTKATAGIHFLKVLRSLGLEQEVAARLRTFPNGTTAMREMAACADEGVVGCTQVTEILFTPGVVLAGGLPAGFELATVYTAAVCSRASNAEAAAQLIARLASGEAAQVRASLGFDPL